MAALLYDETSRGERGRESERREGQGAGMLAMWRQGGVRYAVVGLRAIVH